MESTSPKKPYPKLTDFSATTNDILLADGFDSAFMGICRVFDMSHDEAVEYLEYNVVGAWVGTGTPAFLFGHEVSDEVIKKLRTENSYGKGHESVDVVTMIAEAHLEKMEKTDG